MKAIHSSISLILLFFTGLSSAVAQSCPNESFTFFDQYEIDQFILDYPDCEKIDGSVTITGFINNLDGLSNIRVITGDLTVQYSTELEDLSGLENLDSIHGTLIIVQSSLTSLDGIQEIKSIGGNLIVSSAEFLSVIDTFDFLDSLDNLIISNSAISTLSGFSQLRYAKRLSLSSNLLITDLDGLSSLEYIEQIEISHNSQLTLCNTSFICESLQNPAVTFFINNNGPGCNNYFALLEACQETCPAGFFFSSQEELDQFVFPTSNCTKIRGDIYVQDADNTAIFDLSALSGITSIDSSLVIWGNPEITSLSVFENLEYIGDDLIILDNRLLTNLNGMESISRLGGDCTIGSCHELTSLNGLNNLSHIAGNLNIGANALENLDQLNKLDTVNGHLYIGESLLQNLQGLENLKLVKSVFQIEGDNLISFDGIDKLTHIGGLHVGYTDNLLEMDALEGVSTITYDILIYENKSLLRMPTLPLVDTLDGALLLFDNDKITDLNGFNNLKFIKGKVEISDMPGLTTLDGLENVELIDGYLYIARTGLHNLDVLHNLLAINGSLTIRDNEELKSIVGMDQVDPASITTPTYFTDLRISGNPLLELCSSPTICGILENPDNPVFIEGNATGCDDVEEILAGCMVAVHDIDQDDLIQIFPNPATVEVNIEMSDINNLMESMEVYNMLGIKVYAGQFEKLFSFSSYSEGNYLMVFRTKDHQVLRKLVVVVKE